MIDEMRRFDLLLIDEFGFDRLEREAQAQASTFYYRLLDARTGRRSTALATNIDFAAWADYLGDPPLATAFLDRLVRRRRDPQAHRVRSTGPIAPAVCPTADRPKVTRAFSALISSPLRRFLPTSHSARCGDPESVSPTPLSA